MDKILPSPEGFNIKETAQGIMIHYRWYKPKAIFPLIIFSVFWFGFLVFWFKKVDFIVFQVFGFIFLIAGFGLIWYIVCLFINKTDIIITSQDFAIKHSPLPFPTYKNSQLKRSDIEQVYIKEEFTYNKHKHKTLNGYSLNILSPKEVSNKVLSYDTDEYEKVFFLKRKVEKYMNIEPKSVEGEYIK